MQIFWKFDEREQTTKSMKRVYAWRISFSFHFIYSVTFKFFSQIAQFLWKQEGICSTTASPILYPAFTPFAFATNKHTIFIRIWNKSSYGVTIMLGTGKEHTVFCSMWLGKMRIFHAFQVDSEQTDIRIFWLFPVKGFQFHHHHPGLLWQRVLCCRGN